MPQPAPLLHQSVPPWKPILLGYKLNKRQVLEVPPELTNQHAHIIGQSGVGKSMLLQHLFLSHLERGHGVTLIDPAGMASEQILSRLAQHGYFNSPQAYEHLIYVEFKEGDWYFPFNILKLSGVSEADRMHLVIEAMKRAFPELDTETGAAQFTVATSHALDICLQMDWSIVAIEAILSNRQVWKKLSSVVTGDPLHVFFQRWWQVNASTQYAHDSAYRRAHQLNAHPITRNTLGQYHNKLDFKQIMDSQTCVLVNLRGVHVDEYRSYIGALILHGFEQAAFRRDPHDHFNHYLLVDEFPTIAGNGKTLSGILDRCRQYGLFITMAHQHLPTDKPDLIRALAGADLKICFRVNYHDANTMAHLIGYIDPNLKEGKINWGQVAGGLMGVGGDIDDFPITMIGSMMRGASAYQQTPVAMAAQFQEWVNNLMNAPKRGFYAKLGIAKAESWITPDLPDATGKIEAVVDNYHRLYYTRTEDIHLPYPYGRLDEWEGRPTPRPQEPPLDSGFGQME